MPIGPLWNLLDPNPCLWRRIMMVWSERRGFWTLARIPFAVTKRRRAAIPEILLSVSVGFCSGTTILGTIFYIPGISVPGHQTGNRWFVHTESPRNIIHDTRSLTEPCQWLCPDYLIEPSPGWTHDQLTMVQTGYRYWNSHIVIFAIRFSSEYSSNMV